MSDTLIGRGAQQVADPAVLPRYGDAGAPTLGVFDLAAGERQTHVVLPGGHTTGSFCGGALP